MRILVTGVTGQIGSALVSRLASFGTVLAADRSVLDLSKPHEISERLSALAPDAIVNPAAYTAVDRAEDEPETAFMVNCSGPEALAQWACRHEVPLLHFSTDYVFNGKGLLPWREEDAAAPLSVYGASKLAGENAIRAIGGSHLIIRTSWIYTAEGSNFFRTIARLALSNSELRIVADQFGAPTSAAIVADTVAVIFERTDRLNSIPDTNSVLHVAASGYTSWHGFAVAIVEGLRSRGYKIATERIIPISTSDYSARAARPSNSQLSLGNLLRTFGHVPPAWREGLQAELARFDSDNQAQV